MEKILRSRVLEYFPFDLRVDLELLSRRRDISNAEKQDEIINLLRKYNIGDVVKLGSGTNRYAFKIGGYVIKVATDQDGRIDNMKEFRMAPKLYPYVTQIFEISENGTLLVAEYIQPFTAFGEMLQYADKIRNILRILSSQYLIGDVGISANNYGNWGLRVGYDDPVCLDFAYVYEVNSGLFLCTHCNSGSVLVPNNDFTQLVCPNPNCQKIVKFEDIRRKIGNDVHRQEIGDLTDSAYRLTEASCSVTLDPTKSLYLKSEKEETKVDNPPPTEITEEEDITMNVYELSQRMFAYKKSVSAPKEVEAIPIEDDQPINRHARVIEGSATRDLETAAFIGTIDNDDDDSIFPLKTYEYDDSKDNDAFPDDIGSEHPVAINESEPENMSEDIPANETEMETAPEQEAENQNAAHKPNYMLSYNCRKYLYRDVSELSKRMVIYLDTAGILKELNGHYNSKLSESRVGRILQTAIFKSLTAYLHFSEERVMRNDKEVTRFIPPEDITNPEYFDTIVFIDQYWRFPDIRKHTGDPAGTLKMYDRHYPNNGVHGINRNWLRYLEDSLKTNMFSLDNTGRNLIIGALDGTWAKDPTETIRPDESQDEINELDVDADIELDTEDALEDPKNDNGENTNVDHGSTEVIPETNVSVMNASDVNNADITIDNDDSSSDILSAARSIIGEIYKNITDNSEDDDDDDSDYEDDEYDDEDDDDENPVPVQIFIISEGDYKVTKIIYEDESGDVAIPIYMDLDDDGLFPDLTNVDPFSWLKHFCPERTFSTDDPSPWLKLNDISLPCNNIRFATITPDRDEYFMGYYFYAGVYHINNDDNAGAVEDDIPYLKKIAWLAEQSAIPACMSHCRLNLTNDDIYTDADEVKEMCEAFYKCFNIHVELPSSTESSIERDDDSNQIHDNQVDSGDSDDVPQTPYGLDDIEPTDDEMKMNPYLAPIEALNEHPDHDQTLPVFRKTIEHEDRMFEHDR